MFKSLERIGHGDIGEVSWEFVLLAQSLELLSCEAGEIHSVRETLDDQNKLFWSSQERRLQIEWKMLKRLREWKSDWGYLYMYSPMYGQDQERRLENPRNYDRWSADLKFEIIDNNFFFFSFFSKWINYKLGSRG